MPKNLVAYYYATMKLVIRQRIAAVILLCVSLILFFVFGLNAHSPGAIYIQNCSDLVNMEEPCELHMVKFGVPFIYAYGHPLIPGNTYTRENIKPVALIGNAVIWIISLPLIFTIAVLILKPRK